jgi:hypothetical protein
MKRRMKWVLAAAAAALAALLTGCTLPIALPYRRVAPVTPLQPGEQVVVALTSTEFHRDQRRAFFHQTRAVLADLPAHDGLIGYSVRFQWWGTQAWTLTVWRDAAARDQFASAQVHQRAMQAGQTLLKSVKSRSVPWPASEAPPSWKQAIQILERPPEERE